MYIKTIDLWADGNEEKLRSGELKLSTGQYVWCGDREVRSRFVSVDNYSINVAHGANSLQVSRKFTARIKARSN